MLSHALVVDTLEADSSPARRRATSEQGKRWCAQRAELDAEKMFAFNYKNMSAYGDPSSIRSHTRLKPVHAKYFYYDFTIILGRRAQRAENFGSDPYTLKICTCFLRSDFETKSYTVTCIHGNLPLRSTQY